MKISEIKKLESMIETLSELLKTEVTTLSQMDAMNATIRILKTLISRLDYERKNGS